MKRILFVAAATIAICLSTTATYAQNESLKLRFPHTVCLHRRERHVCCR